MLEVNLGTRAFSGDMSKPLLKRPRLTEGNMGYYNSFIVRVWRGDGEPPEIRGQIEHVNSREKVYFADETHMHQFIISHLDPPSSEVNDELDESSSDENNAG